MATQDVEVVYVCWDVLHIDGRNVNSLPLLDRHKLLRKVVRDAPPEGAGQGWWQETAAGAGDEHVRMAVCNALLLHPV